MITMHHHFISPLILLLQTAKALEHPVPTPPITTNYWAITPPLNHTDALYAGLPQLRVLSETLVYNGTQIGRTYAHHPSVYYENDIDDDSGRVFLQYSTSPIDEDAIGQESWLSTSTDGGVSWSTGVSILPTALLENQTEVGTANYSFWCERRIWQRAVHPVGWVRVRVRGDVRGDVGGEGNEKDGGNEEEDDYILYAVSQTTLRYCWGDDKKGTKAAGRIARRINRSGEVVGDPCWTEKNEWTDAVLFNETVYGTRYGMRYCEHAAYIERYLKEPATTPAWGSWLYSTKMYAADDVHDVQEPTNAVWFGPQYNLSSDNNDSDGTAARGERKGCWERFWRDISSSSIMSNKLWVEHTPSRSGETWYPKREEQHGNAIFETDIPDIGSKTHYGVLPSGSKYLIHNPRNNPERYRQPLTIATGRVSDGGRFTGIGVLKTNASTVIVPDTRGLKRLMFSYPTAVLVGDRLVVGYSENKENVWVSVVRIGDLL